MNKLKFALGGLLALQLAAVIGLYWQGRQQAAGQLSEPLLAFEAAAIDGLVIGDGKDSIALRREGERWRLPGDDALPADAGQLNALLSRLQNLRTGWPVATTESAQTRFEVADDKFQRRLELRQGDRAVATLLVGTSPGFRKVNVRRPGDDAIYSVPLNSYELPATGREWLDKTLLGADDLQRIQGPDYTLEKRDDSWTLSGDGAEIPLDPAAAEQLAAALSRLRVLDVFKDESTGESTDEGEGEEVEVTVTAADGEWTYSFAQVGDQYVVTRSDRATAFTVSQLDYDRITQVGLPQLAKAEPEAGTPAAGTPAAGMPAAGTPATEGAVQSEIEKASIENAAAQGAAGEPRS